MKNASARQAEKFRDHARFVVAHHFGSQPARIKQLSGGLSNFVFEAKHAEGAFVVRISPDRGRLNTFIKEHWCERAVRKAGVPTAEILETGDSLIPFPYVIARRVDGIEGTSHPDQLKVTRELGRVAAKINAIHTKGFGETFDWSNNELSRNSSFKDYFEGEYRYENRLAVLRKSRLCSSAKMKTLERVCRQITKLRPKPVLNHGDLRLKNVLADEDGKIVAVIDWEKATSNAAPLWEFSLALHDLGIDHAEQFVAGYGIKPRKLAEIAPVIKTFNLLNYTDEIIRATGEKDKPALERLKSRFDGAFDLYSI